MIVLTRQPTTLSNLVSLFNASGRVSNGKKSFSKKREFFFRTIGIPLPTRKPSPLKVFMQISRKCGVVPQPFRRRPRRRLDIQSNIRCPIPDPSRSRLSVHRHREKSRTVRFRRPTDRAIGSAETWLVQPSRDRRGRVIRLRFSVERTEPRMRTI
jgi:hypothetical protein